MKRYVLKLTVGVAALLYCVSMALAAEGVYDVEPTFSPYSSGTVKRGVLEAALAEINYIRGLAGLSNDITISDDYTVLAQHGAVLMDANNVMSHYPTKPADMPQDFYELGYEGTSHSNIAFGQRIEDGVTMGNISLGKSITLWMGDEDENNIARVGHRRGILSPYMQQTGFGISTRRGYSAMYTADSSRRDNYETEFRDENQNYYYILSVYPYDCVAWPTKGTHPLSYFGSSIPWSVMLYNLIRCDENITVKLTRESDGQTWNFSKTQSDGYFNIADPYYTFRSGNDTYTFEECIIFRPDNVSYHSGETWTVEITGLRKGFADSESVTISYTTTFSGSSNGGGNDDNSGGGGCNGGLGILALLAVAGVLLKKSVSCRPSRR